MEKKDRRIDNKDNKKWLNTFCLAILNGIIFVALSISAGFVARYGFLRPDVANISFGGLCLCLWVLGIIYIKVYK
jgi:hypothetical protein